MRRFFPLAALACWLAALTATPAASAQTAWAQAEAQSLWAHDTWRRLLHYKPAPGNDRWRSDADDPRFFLAPDGADDPRAEMAATLAAFAAPASAGDEHAQCRFVARLTWLESQLDLGALPQPDCAAYRDFRALVQADRAVLVFPAYYLNSPSSMFGHTLLRLDAGEQDGGGEYLSFAVNFGALVDANDNGLFYAFRGLTGGYPGQFEVDHYYQKIRDYNRDENRDIWEYRLNLTAAETDRLIQHLWELKGINFAYYFFDENCSYRVLELLEVARPGVTLTAEFPLTAIPIDTIRAVQQAGMVTGRRFRPAQGTVLQAQLAALPRDLRRQVQTLSEDPSQLQQAPLQALDRGDQAAVVSTAYRYLRFTQTRARAQRNPDAARRSLALLRELKPRADALPPDWGVPAAGVPPDLSHGSRRVSVGVGREAASNVLHLGFRMALHSLAENGDGFPFGAQINLGNLDLRVDEQDDLSVERFDVVDILSLSPRDRFFKPLSWAVQTGVERQWVDEAVHRVAQVNGGVGATLAVTSGLRVYGLLAARLEYNHGFDTPLQPALGLRSGVLGAWGPLTLRGEVGSERFANGRTRTRWQWQQNLALARHHALQLQVDGHDQRAPGRVAVALRYHWYY